MTIRLRGERFETSTPHWLLNAAQTHSAAQYLRQIATELRRAPVEYGFDPGALYSVCVQTWDRAQVPISSLAFGRQNVGQDAVGLIPDVYYIDSYGFRTLRREAMGTMPWAHRIDTVIWRGSVTGSGPYTGPEEIPRLRLARSCKAIGGTDVALFAVHPTMADILPIDRVQAYIDAHGLGGEGFAVSSFGRYRYSIDIDGHANAWGLLEKLILGCCVLKVASSYEQWYYDRLKPWVHYVPVAADLSDLAERIDWCRSNEDHSAWIAANGALLGASLTIERELPRSCFAFLRTAGQAPVDVSKPRIDTDRLTNVLSDAAPEPFARARSLEQRGDFEGAIVAYGEYSRQSVDAAEALFCKAALYQETGQIALAVNTLRTAAAGNQDLPKLRLAQMISALNRDIEAATLFSAVRQSGGSLFADASMFLSQAASRLGWIDVAFWSLPDLGKREPDWWTDARAQARQNFQLHRDALGHLLRKRRAAAGDDRWPLAVALFAVGRLSSAARLCEALLAEDPEALSVIDLKSRIIARADSAAAALAYLQSLPTSIQAQDEFSRSLTRYLPEIEAYDALLAALPINENAPSALTYDARLAKAFALLWLGRGESLRAHCSAWMDQAPEEILPAALLSRLLPIRELQGNSDEPGRMAQYWQGATPPDDVAFAIRSWSARHPTLHNQLFNRESARAFLEVEHGGAAVAAFDRCPDAKSESLLFALAWLDRNGGLFVDVDQFCTSPMPTLFSEVLRADIVAPRSGLLLGYLKRGFVGGRAGSPIIRATLDAAIHSLNTTPPETLSVWHALGAGQLTRSVGRHLAYSQTALSDGFVQLLPPQFYDGHIRTELDLAYKKSS